ncbi:hypothetical protein BST36_17355 [Mycolicibacterium moriokaense]|uniref:Uncharacterized protein n=1 Tax=Mycolicibacterium moriokaense TaxID=39691 RepID=A0AAD1HGM0_9MYCO|nr:hypothetical protein [Mycolicibacterium moriokaense]MCV7037355.1 hypothetical protein [Mycolicibacterium moriokaense]ORB21256.1 hypothetical protein BST36_17355 [Mycolicibacterium moriokaense]BBX04314.1 hypothetical protein MMOR_52500 [Mycolicibacterium moriokaense]
MKLFRVAEAPWVTAVGDGTQLTVARSLACSVSDPKYLPVAAYIEDHGLVLFETAIRPEQGMYGRCEVSHYTTPEVRSLLLMNLEENR